MDKIYIATLIVLLIVSYSYYWVFKDDKKE
jgi:hypothetical protein